MQRQSLPTARLAAALLLLSVSACTAQPTTAPAAPHFDTVQVTIKGKPFTLYVADTDRRREYGLMNRRSLPADHGMIFLFDSPGYYRFWMKNTLIPLDIVFLDASGKVIDIETMKPLDETPIGPDQPDSFAIELNAGAARRIHLSKGDTLALPEKFLKHSSHSDEK